MAAAIQAYAVALVKLYYGNWPAATRRMNADILRLLANDIRTGAEHLRPVPVSCTSKSRKVQIPWSICNEMAPVRQHDIRHVHILWA